jgi:hypothetical protein
MHPPFFTKNQKPEPQAEGISSPKALPPSGRFFSLGAFRISGLKPLRLLI